MLEVNSFPAAAPFEMAEGKSAAFHEAQVGFCDSVLALLLTGKKGPSFADDGGAKWRLVAAETPGQCVGEGSCVHVNVQ